MVTAGQYLFSEALFWLVLNVSVLWEKMMLRFKSFGPRLTACVIPQKYSAGFHLATETFTFFGEPRLKSLDAFFAAPMHENFTQPHHECLFYETHLDL